jgi:hypothetical protein
MHGALNDDKGLAFETGIGMRRGDHVTPFKKTQTRRWKLLGKRRCLAATGRLDSETIEL